METFAEVFGEILRDSFSSGAAALYSAIGSEFANVSSAISTRLKVFS